MISASFGRSTISRSGSPKPRPRGRFAAEQRVDTARRGEDQQLVGGLACSRNRPLVPVPEFQLVPRSICPFIARTPPQPILEQTTVIGSRSIIASIGTSSTSPASAKVVSAAAPALGLGAELLP